MTDLGTRFGIDTSQATTSVLVYQGEVLASRLSAGTDPQISTKKLVSGQALLASADAEALTKIDFDPSPFEQIGPQITQLHGTGQGLAVGDTDPNWQIVAVDGQALDKPIALPVFQQPRRYRQPYPNDPQRSQWLALPAPIQQPLEGSTYLFRTQIELPESFDADADRVVGRFMVDNQIRAIRINGQAISFPEQSQDKNAWFTRSYEFVAGRMCSPGNNTIEFEVYNESGADRQVVGLRVAWDIQAGRSVLNGASGGR